MLGESGRGGARLLLPASIYHRCPFLYFSPLARPLPPLLLLITTAIAAVTVTVARPTRH